MNFDFWAARWSQQRIGFHLPEVNPSLLSHGPRWIEATSWDQPLPLAGRNILVPLCGKALDLRWLAALGAQVVGVEFVEQAACAFFEEQGLGWVERPLRTGREFVCATPGLSIRILVADFFTLNGPDDVGLVDAVYDRAALIALAPERRRQYAECLATWCPNGARLLLVTLEHDAGSGPPFTVPRGEVADLFGETFAPTLVADTDLLLAEPQFQRRGASHCRELVWLGTRR